MNDKDYDFLKMKVKKISGLDLEAYKKDQMIRRLDGYITRNAFDSVVSLLATVEKDKEAFRQFMDFLTINVSEFFRDSEQFSVLKTKVIPDLLSRSKSLNIWSAGCSIGAEPYSVAMMLAEINPFGKHRILATDLDDASLAKARNGGPYTESHLEQVAAGVKNKNFVKSEDGYTVAPKFKNMVEFKKHDLLLDRYEVGFDLIMCRNVTIYFTDSTKEKLNRNFANSLVDDGVLFIGSTESLFEAESMGLKRMFASFFTKEDAAKSTGKALADKKAASTTRG